MTASMRGYTIYHDVTLFTEECYQCGVLFAIPTDLKNRLLQNHATFYCPNGHGQHYLTKSDATKLAEERRAHASTQEDLRLAQIAIQRGAVEAKKAAAQVKSLKKKVIATQCLEPGCHRTIDPARMAQHIRTMHPHRVKESPLP